MTVITIVIGALSTIPPQKSKGTGIFEEKKTSEDRSDNSIAKISQNTEKSPRESRMVGLI